MTGITNRTLYTLLVIAIVLTVIGAGASLVKLDSVELPFITGFATATGKVNITIASYVAVSLPVAYVDFQNGSLSGTWTTVNTTTGTNPSTFAEPAGLTVQNDGNVDVNVSVNATPPSTFLGGTAPTYAWNSTTGEGGCPGANMTDTIANFSATHAMACSNLTFRDTADDFDIEIYLAIPSDAGTGLKEDVEVEVFAGSLE